MRCPPNVDREFHRRRRIRDRAERIFEQLMSRPSGWESGSNFERMARNAYQAAEAFEKLTDEREKT